MGQWIACWWICFWRRTGKRPSRSFSTWMRPTIRSTGNQEGRFFHGFYGHYCYLPLYIFCGEFLLCARLRRSNIDASAGTVDELQRIVTQIRAAWPRVQIIIRADSGFAREEIIAWCEAHAVDYVLGLAKNTRLQRALSTELREAKREHARTGAPARVFKDFTYKTRKSWSR